MRLNDDLDIKIKYPITEDLYHQMLEILCWFDFDKVKRILQFLNFRRYTDDDGDFDIHQLKEDALKCMMCSATNHCQWSNGVFKCNYYPSDEDCAEGLVLDFVPVEWNPLL